MVNSHNTKCQRLSSLFFFFSFFYLFIFFLFSFFPFFSFLIIAHSPLSHESLTTPSYLPIYSSTHPNPEQLKPCCAMKKKHENASNQYAPSTNSAPPPLRPHRQTRKSSTS